LDRSHLITGDEFRATLFQDLAHQFSVSLYRGELKCPETLPRVRAVIEHDSPPIRRTNFALSIRECASAFKRESASTPWSLDGCSI
jgi:hypothetical protein